MTKHLNRIDKLIAELCPEGVEIKIIQDVCKNVTSGGTPSTAQPEYYGGNIPWLRTQEVDWLNIYDTEIRITKEGLKNSSAKMIPENSVMELIKQIEINIDYILGLVKKYHEDHIKNRELLVDINKAIDSSVELRNKKELINQFIASLDIHSVVDEDWQKYVEKKKIEELEEIIRYEDLDHDETYKFVRNAFRNGSVATTGTDLSKVLPPVSRFSHGGERTKKRESVLEKLTLFFERFFDISNGKI